jgi:hypothetical protein
MQQIIKRCTDCVAIYKGEHDTFKESVEHCAKAKSSLGVANLSGADLSGADLSWADLSGANLSGANLSGADLSWADLSWANLSGANLSGANLSGADLSGASIDKKWRVTTIAPIGSEHGQLCTIDNQDGRGIVYKRGCFVGTEAEFIAAIAKKHGGTAIEREYLAAIAFVKAKFDVEEVER